MKESVLDVLIYLLEQYEEEHVGDAERESLTRELVTAGFERKDIGLAWGWLDDFATQIEVDDHVHPYDKRRSMRVLSVEESDLLTLEGKRFLSTLQQSCLVDSATFEIILDRLLALSSGTEALQLEQIRWVALMVCFNRSENPREFIALDELVSSIQSVGTLH